MAFSKGQIDRLGNKIREEKLELNGSTLYELQNYRTSHKDPLAKIFSVLCKLSKKTHHSSIATFRIKRFESIINKLERYDNMRFSRMWDIGGCRCILRNESDVYKIKSLLENHSEIEIIKENDYLKVPQEDGYKSLHLYIKYKGSDSIIEVQLRTLINHDWATLVEITDVLFETRLKELGDNEELWHFHKLLSKKDNLSIEEKFEIFTIVDKFKYFEKLSEVFARNYLRVRKRWLTMESKSNHRFFLIETKKDDVPKIESFSSFFEAEERYFQEYKKGDNTNIVLTYLQNHDYNLLALAYANYILTFHSFMSECLEIFESLIVESLKTENYRQFYNVFKMYNNLSYSHTKNLLTEIDEVYDVSSFKTSKRNKSRLIKKHSEWIKDIQQQFKQKSQKEKSFKIAIIKNRPNNIPSKYLCSAIIKYFEITSRFKVQKVFRNSVIYNQHLKLQKKKSA